MSGVFTRYANQTHSEALTDNQFRNIGKEREMRKFFHYCTAGVVALLVVFFSAAAMADAGNPPDKVTVIRYFSDRGFIPPFEIASALGWLKAKGIELESVGFSQGGPENVFGVNNGSVDVGGIATPGLINAVAGGGSFVAFPALLFTGVAPVAANATNTLALWIGVTASGGAYRKRLNISRRVMVPLIITSVVGGLAGAVLLIKTPAQTFLRVLPWLLLGATLLFAFGKHLTGRIAAGISQESSDRAVAGPALTRPW